MNQLKGVPVECHHREHLLPGYHCTGKTTIEILGPAPLVRVYMLYLTY